MEVFSLQEVVEVLGEVMVGGQKRQGNMVDELKIHSPIYSTFEVLVV